MSPENPEHLELHPLTEWPETAELDPEECRRLFDSASAFTIGIEEELMLIAPDSSALAAVSPELLRRAAGDPRFAKELRMAQVEIITPVCASAAQAQYELAQGRLDLQALASGSCRLASAGTHPISTDWGEITDEERYRTIADEFTWAAWRSLVCGLHVHVAVPGADRALAVYNSLRGYLPEIGALAANSPFFEGRDTGVCSVRPKLFQAMPRSGCPPAFSSWEALAQFVSWGRRGGLFPDASHFWWDLRLHPVHGTLELRVADAQTRAADAGAIAAFFQSLVVTLAERYDAGERLMVADSFRISENAWRGLRYGVRGWLVDLESGEPEPTRDRLARLFEEVAPAAARLDCTAELLHGQTLLAGNGAERQRYVAERVGLEGLVEWLVEETAQSALEAVSRGSAESSS
jgi:carboxylate-amine ligase